METTLHVSIALGDEPLNDSQRAVLSALLGEGGTPAPAPAAKAEATPAPAAKKAAAKKAAPAPAAEPEPEPASDDDEYTMEKAVEIASALLAEGKTAVVKAALATVGAARVGEVEEDSLAEFIEALQADGGEESLV